MTTSPLRRWSETRHTSRRDAPAPRARRRRQALGLETLEGRVLLSLTPQMVLDINAGSPGSYPGALADVNGTLFFAADDGLHGLELWKSDGTVAGTRLVKDIFTGGATNYYGEYYPNSSSPSQFTVVNGTAFFTVGSAATGTQLWKSDGSEAGTVLVAGVNANNLVNVNGTLFFSSGDTWTGYDGVELWKSDGTAAGTTMVKDIFPGQSRYYPYAGWFYVPNSSLPSNFTNVNGTLFFTAEDDTNGRELWKSDGTAAGTVRVKDIRPGANSSFPRELTNINGMLFFTAQDDTNGHELWKSDGTAAGTVRVKDIRPGAASSYADRLTNANGTLFFSAGDGTTGPELWKSDGTAAGTTMVKDIYPGANGGASSFAPMGVVGSTFYFTANDGVAGVELWRSDGTAAGTVMVKDINRGIGNSFFLGFTAVDGALLFSAYDGVNSPQLWKSDGTAAGTVIVADLAAHRLTNVGGRGFFMADDGIHGMELWKLVGDATAVLPKLNVGDRTVVEGHSGARSATFNVTLSAASTLPVTLSYSTANGTAAGGSDYQAASGTLTFAPGQTSKTITVLINGDRRGEANETFFVDLGGPSNATIADGRGVGTIVDDEPRISINDMTRVEGNSGTTSFVFSVTLSSAYDVPVTVNFATGDGTAKAGENDYVGTSGTLTFAPGQTSKTITVIVKGDAKKEADEAFFVNLVGASSALILDGRGVGTILDDDGALSSPGVLRGVRRSARRLIS